MTRLLMIAPAPVTETAGGVRLDVKFVAGMAVHAAFWPTRITCALRRGAGEITFGQTYARGDLDFDLQVLAPGAEIGADVLSGYDLICASGDDHHCLGLPDRLLPGQKLAYVIEYTQETRFQILKLDTGRGLIRQARSAVWLLQQERRRRQAFARADGLQANGYPAHDVYAALNRNSLLYLDGRMTAGLFATPAEMAAREARRQAGGNLRLIYSGRLEPMKGAQDLLPVARRLLDRGVDFTLDIFGTGSLRPGIAAEIAAAGAGDRIRLHAPVDFETALVPFTRTAADMFLGCHLQSDPSCTYLEAMGCGVAVASYDNRMWARLNSAAGAGWGAPLGRAQALADRIAAVAATPDEITRRSRAALAFARAHDFRAEYDNRMRHLAAVAG